LHSLLERVAEFIFSYGRLEEEEFDALQRFAAQVQPFLMEFLELTIDDDNIVRQRKKLLLEELGYEHHDAYKGYFSNMGYHLNGMRTVVEVHQADDEPGESSVAEVSEDDDDDENVSVRHMLAPYLRHIRNNGLCLGLPTENFYPVRGEDVREIQALCAGCGQRGACGEVAVLSGEKFGFWGGLSERTRRRIRIELSLTKRAEHIAALPVDHEIRECLRKTVERSSDLSFGFGEPGRPTGEMASRKVRLTSLLVEVQKEFNELFEPRPVA
jgi:WhiB family redox-sensing transcriptional regulator